MAHELKDALVGGGDAIQVVERRPDARGLEAQGKSVVMLLYLNKDTWVEQGEVLERDVRAARKAGLKVVMVHENDKEKGGCEFGDFFGTTPQGLIDDGIYRSACRLILESMLPD